MGESRYFSRSGIWDGGFYELALEIGPRSDRHLLAVMHELWAAPGLRGPYLSASREPAEQSIAQSPPLCGHAYGLAALDLERTVACGAVPIRYESGRDWLHFYLPMGSLGTVFSVRGFPFDNDPHEGWRHPVDTWLADLARHMFKAVTFELALIGFETGTPEHVDSTSIALQGVPASRADGILVARNGELEWFARTRS